MEQLHGCGTHYLITESRLAEADADRVEKAWVLFSKKLPDEGQEIEVKESGSFYRHKAAWVLLGCSEKSWRPKAGGE